MLRAAFALLFSLPLSAAPLQILAIGDSLTEEYAFEIPFTAPVSDSTNANIRNWPELLRIFRASEADLGLPYEGTVLSYPDLRDGGHPLNFGIPGFTITDWRTIINTSSYPNPFDSDFFLLLSYYETRLSLIEQIPNADVVVIFLGGNDLKENYFNIFAGTESGNYYSNLVEELRDIHDFVFTQDSTIPIVVCTIPDVGATPQLYNSYTDPIMAASARAKIAALNQDIIDMVAEENAKAGHNVDSAVARIDHLTDRTFDQSPFQLNGSYFTLEGDPENPPDRVFARDNFHPSTVAQALITNEIMEAINEAAGTSLTPFTDREILANLLGLDPDQPFLDWIDGYTVADTSMTGDSDHDRLPNIVEMALGTPPDQPSSPISGNWLPTTGLTWTPDPLAADYVDLFAEESTDLDSWDPVPQSRLLEDNGTMTASPPVGPTSHFGRLNALPR
ncbi:SGNH/GDSL hydrolase family protein [Haloferula sp.]|uniref:SGNH/GDSL hydrolase family protein n=1 Tax=Haloferula sp. TaxID=2497595 RepID=UPI00329D60DB